MLRPFGLFALVQAAIEIYNHDWWAAAILGVAVFVTGGIGQGLPKNKRKSFREFTQGHDTDPANHESSDASDDGIELPVTNALLGFSFLVTVTFAALGIHFALAWWIVLLMAVGLWFGTILFGAIVTL
jgi:hypothetical protein